MQQQDAQLRQPATTPGLVTGDRISGSISRADVAEVAVISLWHPKAANKTFELIKAGEEEIAQSSLEAFFEGL